MTQVGPALRISLLNLHQPPVQLQQYQLEHPLPKNERVTTSRKLPTAIQRVDLIVHIVQYWVESKAIWPVDRQHTRVAADGSLPHTIMMMRQHTCAAADGSLPHTIMMMRQHTCAAADGLLPHTIKK
jgi:hypothetical protein